MECIIERNPSEDTINQIVSIARDYTKDYFTTNVPEDTRIDLMFQRTIYLKEQEEIISFINFTCMDGTPQIMLMATKRTYGNRGYGKKLMLNFFEHIRQLGFYQVEVYTVPPKSKPIYKATLDFYKYMGFEIIKEYTELWESGAIQLRANI